VTSCCIDWSVAYCLQYIVYIHMPRPAHMRLPNSRRGRRESLGLDVDHAGDPALRSKSKDVLPAESSSYSSIWRKMGAISDNWAQDNYQQYHETGDRRERL